MEPIHQDWPLYFKDLLYIENKNKNIGVITLWSKKEIYKKKINPQLYNTIGQLYSREEGLSSLVRNLLANKNITDLVVVGADLNNSFPALKAFFENGVDENNEVIGSSHYAKLDDNIPQEASKRVIENVTLHDLRSIKDTEELNQYLQTIPEKNAYGEYETYELPELKVPETFPSDKVGFKARGKYVGNVWTQVLNIINKFGVLKKSQQGEDQREVVNLVTVVEEENPDNPYWHESFEFTKDELEDYIPQVTSVKQEENLEYTYGQRLMDHEGIDQIEEMVTELNKAPWTRRAVASTWNVQIDSGNPKCPCLITVQALVQENKLYFTCYFRSNDMMDAWPRNALALRKLQKNISEKSNLEMGSLTTISCSAHIYERSFNKVNDILEKEKSKTEFNPDPYGSIVVTIDGDEIVVQHLAPEGKRLDEFRAKSAAEAYKKIGEEMKISDITHAMDIGCELQKAEHAIKLGKEYKQDNPIDLSSN